MPKLKTHKGTSKRTKVTGSGKITHRRPFGNHFLSKKSGSRKRGYAKDYEITGKAKKSAGRLLGGKSTAGKKPQAKKTDSQESKDGGK